MRRLLSSLAQRLTMLLGEPLFHLAQRRTTKPFALQQVRSVLVVRPDQLGDVVLTSPLLRELRCTLPAAWITLVVKPSVRNLVEHCPYVDEVLTYEWQATSRVLRPWQRHWRALLLARRQLWRRRYDLAIVPRWDNDVYHASFVAYLSGATWRAGYAAAVNAEKLRWGNYDRLFTHVLDNRDLCHEAERGLELLRFLGGDVHDERLEAWTSAADETFAAALLREHGVDRDTLLVAFVPGAGEPKRMWPLERFVALGRWLEVCYNARVLVLGGPGEEPLGACLEQQLEPGVVNISGRVTIRQTAALLRRCRLYVGNDTGPMHLAAAAGTPVVMVSCHQRTANPLHANAPERFGPWQVPHVVLRPVQPLPPCRDGCSASVAHCVKEVTVEQAQQVVVALLRETPNRE